MNLNTLKLSSVVVDCEMVIEAGSSGLNTRSGDLITFKFKYNTPSAGGGVMPSVLQSLIHIVLQSDHILAIHDTGVRVYDWLMM